MYFVRYFQHDNRILFPTKIGANIVQDFASAIALWLQYRPSDPIILDFSEVIHPYSNGMLAIIATVQNIRTQGYTIQIRLPANNAIRKIFRANNWAFYLDPLFAPSESVHDRHLVTRQFTSFTEIPPIINDFMDVVLRNIRMPKDIVSALEWSINEVCDNVINHSDSPVGGFVQVITYKKSDRIAFTVADAGKGILSTLKEGIPSLRTDAQAIGEAIKSGVTRNKEYGQGNGLAGTLRITTMAEGNIDITSGRARFFATSTGSNTKEKTERIQYYKGTLVSGQISMSNSFSISKALEFNGVFYIPLNVIDTEYEMEDKDCLLIKMSRETTGVGTRHAGKQMHIKILNLIEAKPGYPIYIDWEGIPVISSSFADEFMGKLFLTLGPINFSAAIRNKNMEQLVHQLLDKAILQRLNQQLN